MRLPSSGGIDPLNRLSARSNHSSSLSLPNTGGIDPLKPFLEQIQSNDPITVPSVTTPYHLPIGASVNQLPFLSQLSPFVA